MPPPRLVLEDNVERMDDSRDVSEDGQQDVDEEVGIASTFKEDTQWWDEDGEDDLDDIASGERHDD